MTRLIDADALSKKLCETTIFIKDGEMFQRMINDAPTIELDGDLISRSQAIKDISEWATDILHQDRLVKEDAIHILESLPSAEQVTGKLKNPCDSLLTADSEACKEQKSKLDLISRQDAIEAFYEPKSGGTYAELDDGSEWYMTSKQIYAVLDSLPSAEPKTGEWQGYNTDNPGWKRNDGTPIFMVCDQCHGTVLNNGSAHWNYCPNCGARMYKGGEDDADE